MEFCIFAYYMYDIPRELKFCCLIDIFQLFLGVSVETNDYYILIMKTVHFLTLHIDSNNFN